VKNVTQNKTRLNINTSVSKNFKNYKNKTTNINILLNRVKLDKKRDFKKKLIFLLVVISVISAVSVFALI
jgi:hypothetical protein|tara:strand:+ start:366 stop:575 length:210 start_codon:yes stop_codon:yes gene_type:complete